MQEHRNTLTPIETQPAQHSQGISDFQTTALEEVNAKNVLPLHGRSKAGTLAFLEKYLSRERIPKFRVVSRETWSSVQEQTLAEMVSFVPEGTRLIARSSAKGEDQLGNSQAGAFLSQKCDRTEGSIREGVEAVFRSYRTASSEDEVLLQVLVQDVLAAGVVFTRTPSSGADYYVIEYEVDGGTDLVTSGRSNAYSSCTVLRRTRTGTPAILGDLLIAVNEVENLCGGSPLDIEFAIGADGQARILQARPLCCPSSELPVPSISVIEEVSARIQESLKVDPFLQGDRNVLGVMPDWNPAEIIGTHPRQLASSMYRDLITDQVWATARERYGYRNVSNTPLLVSLCGLQYVNVRASLNSLLPGAISDSVAARLVDAQLDYLSRHPECHDKLEFEVAASCWTPSVAKRLHRVAPLLSPEERAGVINDLLIQTRGLVDDSERLFAEEKASIARLVARQATLSKANLSPIDSLRHLLNDCRTYGTSAFACLARLAFVGTDMLRSLGEEGVLSKDDIGAFESSIVTVSGQMLSDLVELDRAAFLERYGHLRPGTYDIRVPRYDEDPDRYFYEGVLPKTVKTSHGQFRPAAARVSEITAILESANFRSNGDELLQFVEGAVIAREHAKFVFSRSISDALSIFGDLGAIFGLSLDELSHADMRGVLASYEHGSNLRDALFRSIDEGRMMFERMRDLQLPPLIFSPEDALSFVRSATLPNFVTGLAVQGQVVTPHGGPVDGKIVMIEQADPGYDWLFAHNIKGFITAYGGANSHMAIRAAELGVPAVIGAGEKLFEHWRRAGLLRIDCDARTVEVII